MNYIDPFDISRQIATNVDEGYRSARDSNTIERILSEVSQNPTNEIMQDAIGQILSRISPERQQQALQTVQGIQQQRSAVAKQKQIEDYYRSQGLDPRIASLDPGIQREMFKSKKDTHSSIDQAKDLIKRQKEILASGHIGPYWSGPGHTSRKGIGPKSKEANRLRAEYARIGKALIQHATTMPIKNRAEFETFAEGMDDPDLTLEEAQGNIDGMERIINRTLSEEEGLTADPAQSAQGAIRQQPTETITEEATIETGVPPGHVKMYRGGKAHAIPEEYVQEAIKYGFSR